MKKVFVFLLIVTMAFSLAACGSANSAPAIEQGNAASTAASSTPTEPITTPVSTESSTPEAQPDTSGANAESSTAEGDMQTEPAGNGPKVLIAYFSATGTTKKIAEYAADAAGADQYEIVPSEPYTSDDLNYSNDDCRANTEMNDPSSRPAIDGSVANMADYDIVFIGYPIWWGEAPRIVSTFMESYDFSGKTVVTFSTSGGSGHNDRSIKALVNGANWITGTRLKSGSSQSDVAEWINGLGLAVSAK